MKLLNFALHGEAGWRKIAMYVHSLSHEIELKDVTDLRKHEQGRNRAKKRRGGKRTLVWLALASAALIGVLVCPSPYNNQRGGVELYGDDPEVEVYGPQLPENIVGGYTEPAIQSVVLPEDGDGDDSTLYVYASEGQKNYHLYTCRNAYASAKKLTLYEAYYLGYKPGKCCNAPEYIPGN